MSQFNYVPSSTETQRAVTRGLQGATVVTLPSFSFPSQYQQPASTSTQVAALNAPQTAILAPSSNVATLLSQSTAPVLANLQVAGENQGKISTRTDVVATPLTSLTFKKDGR